MNTCMKVLDATLVTLYAGSLAILAALVSFAAVPVIACALFLIMKPIAALADFVDEWATSVFVATTVILWTGILISYVRYLMA